MPHRNRHTIKFVSAGMLTIFAAGSALAVPQGAYWYAINNCTNPITGEFTGLHGLWRTYDLYLSLEPGDEVIAADFGISGGISNKGLRTDGIFFNGAPFSGDNVSQNIAISEFAPEVAFDSAVTMNGDAPVSFAQNMDWDPSGATGAWFVNPGVTGTGGPDFNGFSDPDDMWVARVTVSFEATFLGGEMFVSGTGPNGDFGLGGADLALGFINIPSVGLAPPDFECVPTPGAASLFLITGIAGFRRKR